MLQDTPATPQVTNQLEQIEQLKRELTAQHREQLSELDRLKEANRQLVRQVQASQQQTTLQQQELEAAREANQVLVGQVQGLTEQVWSLQEITQLLLEPQARAPSRESTPTLDAVVTPAWIPINKIHRFQRLFKFNFNCLKSIGKSKILSSILLKSSNMTSEVQVDLFAK
ncbi:hypothetical protein BpHYR1_029007 [Brachionus plicatilis]|uniref:Uncharacterized protein n=1 Tax=Brachionus plicatilis TaxID=10195 RepID=A0A3M7SW90_BRAPC|nr:hypothetical protein BpHYR1_029007 [Brachionus plicatilis]